MPMDYVDIVADVTMFQGQPQLNVKRARKAREGEYNPADYLPVSSKDIEVMYKELLGFVAKSERSVSFKASEKSFCRRCGVCKGI